MGFNSLFFLYAFLPLALVVYYLTPGKLKQVTLLLISLGFFYWGDRNHLLAMLICSGLVYIAGVLIAWSKRTSPAVAKSILALSITGLVLLLGYYKYYNFTVQTVNHVLGTQFGQRSIQAPLGISFAVFLWLAYLIDVSRKQEVCVKQPLYFFNFSFLFMRAVSGPIQRIAHFQENQMLAADKWTDILLGFRRLAIGLAKKVMLADLFGQIAFNTYAPRANYPSVAWLSLICYTLQIYYDFAGYSDMAIGIARMFGYNLPENFNYPYWAKHISDFWRRWHISLSTWFRDYLYIPLGGNRTRFVYLNIMIVFLITGIWHGANYTFILWGVLHGIFSIINRLLNRFRFYREPNHLVSGVKRVLTLLGVTFAWELFRAPNIQTAFDSFRVMFGQVLGENISTELAFYLDNRTFAILVLGIILATPIIPQLKKQLTEGRPKSALWWEHAATCGSLILFVLAIIFEVNSNYTPHIYFQF